MPLSLSQNQKIEQWITSKFPAGLHCPCCQDTTWGIAPEMVATPVIENGTMSLGGAIIPYIQLMCKNCGCIQSFAAKAMGVA